MKPLIQSVDERETGAGSTPKGFRRYRRKWLEKLRSKKNSDCIANEQNTSQLCLFCFQRQHVQMARNKGIRSDCVSVTNGKAAKSRLSHLVVLTVYLTVNLGRAYIQLPLLKSVDSLSSVFLNKRVRSTIAMLIFGWFRNEGIKYHIKTENFH